MNTCARPLQNAKKTNAEELEQAYDEALKESLKGTGIAAYKARKQSEKKDATVPDKATLITDGE